jgi:threo-3-hydroxy-L-aspartate ammonia-lyase
MRLVVSDADIREAAARLHGVAVGTTLVPFPGLSPSGPGKLLIKPECLQPVGSFKLRGAYNAISARPAADRSRGVVAHSSGNHGLAVAYAARLLGLPAVIVVPETAPAVKTDAILACGGELVTVAPTLAARLQGAQDVVEQRGYTLIPPFDHPDVIAGQGTIGLEIMASQPDTDLILISGIATAARSVNPAVTVIGVEPELAADARDSLAKGERVAWPARSTQQTVADALRVEQVGELPFALMREYVAGVVTVTDQQILAAMRRLATEARLVAEPGGAAAVAAWLFARAELPAAQRPVAVLSGGNVDPALLARVIAGDGPGTGPGAGSGAGSHDEQGPDAPGPARH